MEEASLLSQGNFEDPSHEALRQLGEEIKLVFPYINPFQMDDEAFHNVVLVASVTLCTGLD